MKNWINRVLNLLLYLLLCFLAGTGLMMWWRLPAMQGRLAGGRRGEPLPQVFGLDRHAWGDWHFYAAMAMLVLVVLHLWMNWTWLRKIAGHRRAWPVWTGLAAGAVIVLLFLIAPVR